MPKAEDRSSTDGLEILSVGALYDGPWDKKYWSSSRGKDRYPYPVGYRALRTHNGSTFKMEVHEGSAGPVFQITSADGHSGSGQTPDIAWESFQRKTSRIKLWHTKRFSCKVDGVEFFGFKNTLVQRLLRELLTSLEGASEQSLPSINIGKGSVATEGDIPLTDMSKHPELLSYLTKSQFTGRRNKKCKTANVNSAARFDDQASSKKILKNKKDENLVSVSSWRQEYVLCNGAQDLSSSGNLNCRQDCSTSATELSGKPCQSSSICEDKSHSAQLERQHLEVGSYLHSAPVNSEHIELDRLKCLTKVQIVNPPAPSEHRVQVSETVNDSEVPEDSEITKSTLLYAPDTLDTQQGDTPFPNITSTEEPCIKKDEFGAEVVGNSAGESCPEEETNNDSAYRDFDSVGKEVVRSIMEILLPPAVPLVTYSKRKKKRKHNPLNESPSTLRISPESYHIQPSGNVASSGEFDGNSISIIDRQEDHLPKKYPSSVAENTDISILPDIIENNRCKAEVTYQVNSDLNSTIELGTCKRKLGFQKETETHIDTENLASVTSSSEKPTVPECIQNVQSEADVANQKQQISCAYHVVRDNLTAEKLLEDHASKLASTVDCGLDHNGRQFQKSMDNCYTSRGESAATSNAGQIQINTLVNSRGTPVEEQCIKTGTCGPGNSTICQSSYVDLSKRNYNGPLSESIICRNVGDSSLVEEEASSVSNENKDAIAYTCSNPRRHLNDLLDENMHASETSNHLECNEQAIGCYSHPKRISAVMLKMEMDNIYVCTSCGLLEENGRDLFLYKLQIKGPSLGRPSFIGHSTVTLPILKDVSGTEVPVETSALQFTPGARGLVMLDSIQVPYCIEKRFPCSCSTCASIRCEDNAVKIVQLKKGYASLLVKLKTLYPVTCVLVCEPDCLVALDESGRLYLWFMDPVWSASTQEYVIQSYDFVASRVVELKRIPTSGSLLLGHNGCGDFSLWDIRKCTFVSRFSAPASSILGYLPISLFSWQNGLFSEGNDAEQCKDELMAATNAWLTEFNGERSVSAEEGEDIGIWILACTFSGSSGQPGIWRLGLLVKEMVVLGNSFPRSTAIGLSAGHGIIGTDEGTTYMWDLKAGNKVEILHNSKGVGVSHIATNDSRPFVTAVADENGQLWIYLHH